MLHWLLLTLFSIFCLAGVCLSTLQLPGNWLILAAAIGYDAYYHWQRFGWKWLVAFGALAAAAELAELLASAVVAQRAGASRRAGIGALVGGFAGMILLSIPVPIIGTIVGGLVGCFAGALVMEMTLHDDVAKGTRVGVFAAVGRMLGLVVKLGVSMAMAGASVSMAVHALLAKA